MRAWVVCFVWMLAAVSYAGPREDAAQKRKEGDKFAEQGDLVKALAAYDEAQVIFADPSVLFARAQVLIKLRRYSEAKTAYQSFLDSGKAGKQKDEVKEALEELEIILQTKLVCSSTPPGATVYLNSRVDGAMGVTPFETNLTPGPHRLIFEKEGFEPLVVPVTIQPKISQEAKASLQELPALLLVVPKGDTADTTVFVDGEERGKTPIEVKLSAGDHKVEIRRPPWPSQEESFSVTSGQKLTWEPVIQSGPPGKLSLRLSPSFAKATISGQAEPITDGASVSLYPGRYTLTAAADGYQTITKEVVIESEKELPEDLSLMFEGGRLTIDANRSGVQLSIDGKAPAGVSSEVRLSPGEHTVIASIPGYSPLRTDIYVKKNQELQADIFFRKEPQQKTKLVLGGAAMFAVAAMGLELIGLSSHANALEACREAADIECITAARSFNGPGQTFLIMGDVSAALTLGFGIYGWYQKRQEGDSSISISSQREANP